MPLDLAILTPVNKGQLGPALTKATGNTNFTWEAYNGDIQLDSFSALVTLTGVQKLAQGVFKIVLTPQGSNPVDPNYGTTLSTLIGQEVDADKFATITSSIVDALTYYNLINQDNPNSDEVIQMINSVRVVSALNDPRQINVQISFTTESGIPVSLQVPQIL